MAGLNAPCMTCPDKGCGAYHGQCEKYKKFRKEVEKTKGNQEEKQHFY